MNDSLPFPLQPRERDPMTGEWRTYGFFGYEGHMVDIAISRDAPDALRYCIEQGWIDKSSRMLTDKTVARHCFDEGKAKCADLLADLGWPGAQRVATPADRGKRST